MRSGLRTLLVIVIGLGFGAVLVWAFVEERKDFSMEQEREQPVKTPPRVSTEGGESVVNLNPAIRKKNGIEVTPLKGVSHEEEFRAYGTVIDLQPLVDLRNSYATAKARLEKARAELEASRKEYERLKALQENRNISVKVFQAAEAAWRSDEASARAADTQLKALEGTVRQRWGAVMTKWLLDDSQQFERLMQRRQILMQITLPPANRLPSAPRSARVQTPEGGLALATLVSAAPNTDPRIQGVSFFYLSQARTTDLLPGMNILAYLPNGSPTHGIIVPASAVVWWQGKAWIYVQKNSQRFVRRAIPTEIPTENGWFVTRGLSPHDRIVTSGAELLLSEELKSQIQLAD